MIAPARRAAFLALSAIEGHRASLPNALADARRHLPDERDRALATEIVTGTLRWQRALDHVLVHAASRPIEEVQPAIVTILRLSLHQILHLTRVPASAIVDDAVDLARSMATSRATGFVNAVLRTILRTRHHLPLPPRPPDATDRSAALAYLGVTHSHPDWLVARWLDRVGFEATERWVQFNNTMPALTLRANTLVGTRDALSRALHEREVDTTPTTWAPNGLFVTRGHPHTPALPSPFVVQDEASQLVTETLDVGPGERVLDLCAAPGGKATAIAASMGDDGVVIACDVRPRRLRLLHETIGQSGARSIRVVQVPAHGPLPFGGRFDRVLVDAPCSGLGTVRRDPDIKWRRQPEDLAAFAEAQRHLLNRAADTVRPGGRLVYATCSSEPEENDAVAAAFLETRPDFIAVGLQPVFSGSRATLVDDAGHLHTWPYTHGLEAFFAAAFARRAL